MNILPTINFKYYYLTKEQYRKLLKYGGIVLQGGFYLKDEPGNIYLVDGELFTNKGLRLGPCDTNVQEYLEENSEYDLRDYFIE